MTMDEDNSKTSWVRRTNFSHTVCHRLDSMRLGSMPLSFCPAIGEELKLRSSISDASKLASVLLPVGSGAGLKSGSCSPSMPLLAPSALEHDGDPVLKSTMDTSSVKGSTAGTKSGPPVRAQLEADPRKSSRSGPLGSAKLYHDPRKSSRSGPSVRAKVDPGRSKSTSSVSRRERNSMSKQRSLSPLPRIALSDAFKEARAEGKRYSTPPPSRRESDKSVFGRFFSREASGHHTFTFPSPTETNLIKLFSSTKAFDKLKNRKDTPWARYFDHGGRVTAVETTEEWMVDLSQLYLGLRFASGAHSRLYHGIYKDQPVAVKLIRQPDDDENGELATRLEKQFAREVTHLSHLYHRNVIKLVAACRNPPVFCVITEYLSGGSLRAFLHKLEHKSLPLPKLIAIALDIARGMEYINSQGVIHRDLKPENIIFDQDFCVKIADFGIACEEAYCDLLAEDPGTYRWMAPEMIKHKPYGRKVDVYSFGLLLWEMVTGIIPYEDMTPIQAAFAVVDKNIRPVIPTNCPAALRALIEQCWALLPEKRPEFWQIVKVLEQFETALSQHGTLDLVQNLMCHEHKKWLANWTQKKLKPLHIDGLVQLAPKFL